MKLVIAEKPSAAELMAGVLGAEKKCRGYREGNGWLVSWCFGHMTELCPPEAYDKALKKWTVESLPVFPETWRYSVLESARKQFFVLKKLMEREDVDGLVCAADAGREGELIFRLLYHKCGCRKPVQRLWVSSLEDTAVKKGFSELKSSKAYDSLYEAALCRERADWLTGINYTRLFSVLSGETLNIGRVMTPTLAMTVKRETEISAFCDEPIFRAELRTEGFSAVSENFKTREAAETLCTACKGKPALVTKAETKEKTELPPKLFDLTALQREANRRFGFTARQTLDYAQSLYEKKLITYPRTDSRFLTGDTEKMLPKLVKTVLSVYFKEERETPVHTAQVINSEKVSDHPALLPTAELEKTELSALPKGEAQILSVISKRLMDALDEPFRYAETVLELSAGGTVFRAKGKKILSLGWREREKPKEADFWELPAVKEGKFLSVFDAEVKTGRTSPPKHYTEDTLLSAMETAGDVPKEAARHGIGTPATRAGIIEKLVRKGFLVRKGEQKTKYLIPTEKGKRLIAQIPAEISSPAMTAKWEEKLLLIEKGEYRAEDFIREVKREIVETVSSYTKKGGGV